MQTYSEFSPTGFDSSGAFLPENQEWYVVPVGQNRDSGALDQSNFTAALALLGDESETVEVHRFNHWANGWFEIIIVQPGSEAQKIGEDIEGRLENYPVLDEEDFSKREYDDSIETIESCGADDTQSSEVFSYLCDNGHDYSPEGIRESDIRLALVELGYKAECKSCGEFEDSTDIVSQWGVCADMCKVCVTDYLAQFENAIVNALDCNGLDYRTRNILENAIGKVQLTQTVPNLLPAYG